MNPYEYFNNCLGVQARFLFSDETAHANSLKLITRRGLGKRIDNETVKRLRPQGPGSYLLVSWDSIECWHSVLIKTFGEPKQQTRISLFEKTYQQDTAALAFYSAHSVEKNGKKAYLSNEVVEEYTLNASVLNTLAKYYKNMCAFRKSLRGETQTAWQAAVNDCNRFREVQPHTLPEHADNLRKKLKAYKINGYAVLISGKINNNNARVVTDDVTTFLNNLFAGQAHKPTYTEVAKNYESFIGGYLEVVNNETGELYDPKTLPAISKSSIMGYLSKWQNEIGTEAKRSGDRQKLMQKFNPYHSLQQPKYAGSMISVDDRNPPFKASETGERIWFYNAIDLGSEAFTCWVYGDSKAGIITDFYRQLIRNYAEWGLHLPAELECEMNLNASFTETFLQEGAMFQYVKMEANNARGKRIERYFRELRYGPEKKRVGWLARPTALSESNQADEEKAPKIPRKQIVDGCLRDIEDWNNAPHSKIEGKSRWEVFVEMQHPGIQPTNYRPILQHLGYQTKTSCNAGIIRLNSGEFLLGDNNKIATGSTLIRLMQEVEGQSVLICWLDGNDGEVLKAHIYCGDRLICEAIKKPVYNRSRIEQTEDDLKARQVMSAYATTIQAYMSSRKNEVSAVTLIDNTPTYQPKKAFKIGGVNRYQPLPEPPEPETLPDIPDGEDEENLVPVSTSTKTPLKNRW